MSTVDPRILALLSGGEMELVGLLPNSSNYTFLAQIRHPDEDLLAVYKPREGETPLWDFPEGTLYKREAAAFELACALGWPAVPPTVIREGPHGPGSAQLFVEADPREHYFTLRDERLDDFAAVAAFDVIANNADRKAGHCLLARDGTIWVVDHGVCFATAPKLRTVIWEFAGEPIPGPLLEDIGRVAGELRSGPVEKTLRALLAPQEFGATARRAEHLAASGRFPEPGAGRPYPWPPV
ncbi:MAG TPA: SCO1664 family protein [Actinomycetota bacterium]|nr:SCO1664 family protein [Actinomycetota bacterium]